MAGRRGTGPGSVVPRWWAPCPVRPWSHRRRPDGDRSGSDPADPAPASQNWPCSPGGADPCRRAWRRAGAPNDPSRPCAQPVAWRIDPSHRTGSPWGRNPAIPVPPVPGLQVPGPLARGLRDPGFRALTYRLWIPTGFGPRAPAHPDPISWVRGGAGPGIGCRGHGSGLRRGWPRGGDHGPASSRGGDRDGDSWLRGWGLEFALLEMVQQLGQPRGVP